MGWRAARSARTLRDTARSRSDTRFLLLPLLLLLLLSPLRSTVIRRRRGHVMGSPPGEADDIYTIWKLERAGGRERGEGSGESGAASPVPGTPPTSRARQTDGVKGGETAEASVGGTGGPSDGAASRSRRLPQRWRWKLGDVFVAKIGIGTTSRETWRADDRKGQKSAGAEGRRERATESWQIVSEFANVAHFGMEIASTHICKMLRVLEVLTVVVSF